MNNVSEEEKGTRVHFAYLHVCAIHLTTRDRYYKNFRGNKGAEVQTNRYAGNEMLKFVSLEGTIQCLQGARSDGVSKVVKEGRMKEYRV